MSIRAALSALLSFKKDKPMKTGAKGVALIKSFEGLELTSYKCPAGIWTIGFGHTGPDVLPRMHITEAEADELLRADLAKFERAVLKHTGGHATQDQFDALVSFAYNLGGDALRTSTLLRKHMAGDYAGAADQFARWNRAGGQILAGLSRRRKAEAELYRGAA